MNSSAVVLCQKTLFEEVLVGWRIRVPSRPLFETFWSFCQSRPIYGSAESRALEFQPCFNLSTKILKLWAVTDEYGIEFMMMVMMMAMMMMMIVRVQTIMRMITLHWLEKNHDDDDTHQVRWWWFWYSGWIMIMMRANDNYDGTQVGAPQGDPLGLKRDWQTGM